MRISRTLLAVGLALLLVGCDADPSNPLVPCVQPLYTDVDLDFDPTLLGAFRNKDGDLTFVFEKQGDNEFKLTVHEEEGEKKFSGRFEAHLVRLGSYWFLDFYPGALEVGDSFYRLHWVRAHTIARVWIENDTLRLGFLSSRWLKQRLEDRSVDIDHREVDDSIVVTAPTRDLQDLVFRYATDPEAFGEPLDLHRAKDCLDREGCSDER